MEISGVNDDGMHLSEVEMEKLERAKKLLQMKEERQSASDQQEV